MNYTVLNSSTLQALGSWGRNHGKSYFGLLKGRLILFKFGLANLSDLSFSFDNASG
jgi:hypothetical protein